MKLTDIVETNVSTEPLQVNKINDIKILFIDVDDTLIDFGACERGAMQKVFQKHGIPLTEDVRTIYQEINHGLWRDYELGRIGKEVVLNTRFGRLFQILSIEKDGIAFEQEYQSLLGLEHDVFEDTIEMLEYLQPRYDIYYVTNGVAKTQESKLRLSGLERYAKDIFISELIGYQKPTKEFFQYCIERIEGFDSNKTMIIGDSLTSDMQGGINIGIKTCWLNQKNEPVKDEYKIDYIILSLSQLRNIGF